jgi:hypothetical protein
MKRIEKTRKKRINEKMYRHKNTINSEKKYKT